MLNPDFIYQNSEYMATNKAIIILPEIFGINQNIRNIVDNFAKEFNLLTAAIDFYYPIDGQKHDLDYTTDLQLAIDLKSKTEAGDFIKIFTDTLDGIQKKYPNIAEFSVCGFCFGGKLAFLAGLDNRVTKIFSFYGAGSNQVFYQNKSVVQVLAETRKNDSKLIIKSFFGDNDSSISKEDRQITNQILTENGLGYQEFGFNAGHAFFRIGGQNYDKQSSDTSLEVVRKVLDL